MGQNCRNFVPENDPKTLQSHRHAVPLLRRKSAQKCPKVSPKSAKILEPSCFRQNMLTNIAPGVFQPLHSWILVCPQDVPKSVKTMSESRSPPVFLENAQTYSTWSVIPPLQLVFSVSAKSAQKLPKVSDRHPQSTLPGGGRRGK